MNLKGRVERLAKQRHIKCRECRHRPTQIRVLYPSDEHYAKVEPKLCASCGAQIQEAVLKVRYDDPLPPGVTGYENL